MKRSHSRSGHLLVKNAMADGEIDAQTFVNTIRSALNSVNPRFPLWTPLPATRSRPQTPTPRGIASPSTIYGALKHSKIPLGPALLHARSEFRKGMCWLIRRSSCEAVQLAVYTTWHM